MEQPTPDTQDKKMKTSYQPRSKRSVKVAREPWRFPKLVKVFTKLRSWYPVPSLHGKTMEMVTDFIFLDSKITVYGDCSHEIKRCLLLGRKAMTNLDRVLKSGDITLPTKVCIVKAVVFPLVMYGCESWTIKRLSAKEMMLSNCAGEDSWEFFWLQEDQTSQSQRKSVLDIHWKD